MTLKQTLKKLNFRKQIKIRAKTLKGGGYSLYLDSWRGGKREFCFPKVYFTEKDKHRDKESLDFMQALREVREAEMRSKQEGFSLVNHKAKINFLDFVKSLERRRPLFYSGWRNFMMALSKVH